MLKVVCAVVSLAASLMRACMGRIARAALKAKQASLQRRLSHQPLPLADASATFAIHTQNQRRD
jgi:hypothetical protein